ncbi:MAG: BON domain-containing protein [Nitrospirota bacterium]
MNARALPGSRQSSSLLHQVWLAVVLLAFPSLPSYAEEARIPDQSIKGAIERELLFDQAVPLPALGIRIVDGIVTLTGSVDTILAKDRAARIVRTIRGVRSVVNRIEVRPSPLRTDEMIKADIMAALVEDPAAESFEIGAAVDEGRVTLVGVVDSRQERQLAEQITKGVAGVRAVDNTIKIERKAKRTDREIEAEIEQTLRRDALVDGELIQVTVNKGNVALSGTVGSAAEKHRAVLRAWVAGVERVDASALQVARMPRDETLMGDKYDDLSDDEIRDAVHDALSLDPRVSPFAVTATVADGAVTLEGTVNNLKAKRAAAQDARNTTGVETVNNLIAVRRPQELSDSQIAGRVRNALQRDPSVSKHDVAVSVHDGVVRLSGTVDTLYEKAQADDVAARGRGVKEVENTLSVAHPEMPLVYDPYVNDWYVYDYEWYSYDQARTKSDEEIKRAIQGELWWSPFVDDDQVTVTVRNGIATLTGAVDSPAEKRAAVENAFEGGAVWVINSLLVAGGG